MNKFLGRNRVSLFLLLIITLICAFFADSTERYNNLVSFTVYKDGIYTLEKINNEGVDALRVHVYKSRFNWMLGWGCFFRNVALSDKGEKELYNWEVERIDIKSITLTNNGRTLIFPVTGCF